MTSLNKKGQDIPSLFLILTEKIKQVCIDGASSTFIRKKTFYYLIALVSLGLNNLM